MSVGGQAPRDREPAPDWRGPVVHVDTERGFSGGEVQVLLLMEGLRGHGVPQVLVAPPGSDVAERATQRGFEVAAIGLRHSCDVFGVWRLRTLLRGASLVHLHTGRAAWLGSLAARACRCPAVVTRRMDRPVSRGVRTNFIYRDTARAVIAISPAVRQCLVDGGVPSSAIEVIPDALDAQRLEPRAGREATRAALGVDAGRLLLLSLAQLMHRKGLDVLLRAFASLSAPRPLLAIAGDGPEAGALRELAAALGITDAVRFLGRRDDAGDLLAACDLFVLPSRAEGLGVAALEALGAARAVIATRVGGLADLIVDGQCGLLVPPDDAAALAAAMRRLVDDPSLRARLAAAGPSRLDAGYRPVQYVDRHLAVYRRMLAAASGGRA